VSELRSVLALFAKAPVPGQVKTRLCPPLRPEQAAELYEAMLLDILDQHRDAPGIDLALWYAPAASRAWFEAHAPRAYALYAQQGATLAARMSELFRRHAAEGYTRIVLRGTDSPSLPEARFAESFDALEQADLVLCPDRDGGYNLIGLRRPADALFEVEMSTGSVLEWTVQRARSLGMRMELLAPHHDVDTAADLKLLAKELCERRTPRTRAWLARAQCTGFEVGP
jgi:uncharacterized protein